MSLETRWQAKTWKCICGRIFPIDGKPIYCSGPGHDVYISPVYHTYRLKSEYPPPEEKIEKKADIQLKLL